MWKKVQQKKIFQYRLKIQMPHKGSLLRIEHPDQVEHQNCQKNLISLKPVQNSSQVKRQSSSLGFNRRGKQNMEKRGSSTDAQDLVQNHGRKQRKAKTFLPQMPPSNKSHPALKIDQYSASLISPFRSLIVRLFPVLVKKFSIASKAEMISMKKDLFFSLLSSLIEALGEEEKFQMKKNQSWLKEMLQAVRQHAQKKKYLLARNKLRLQSKTVNKILNPFSIRHEFDEETFKMSSLLEKQTDIENQILLLLEQRQNLIKVCSQKKEEAIEWERKADEAKKKLDRDNLEWEKINGQIKKDQKELERIVAEEQKIKNYVLRQTEVPMMEYVGTEFRRLENEMIDYAVFLQYDPLFSSMTFEPKPFSAVEKYMREDLKWTTLFLERDDKTLEEKSKKMIEFIKDCYHKFVVKDEEMTKVNKLKTQSTLKYIDMMHRWADSFDIKQETLLDLRKEFVVDADNIKRLLKELLLDQNLKDWHESFLTLEKHWKSVQENYKMGNSFY